MEAKTWEFQCGLSDFTRFLMFELNCQNQIANIFGLVKTIRYCKYGLELPFNLTDLMYQYIMKQDRYGPVSRLL